MKLISESAAFQLISVGVLAVITSGSYLILKPNSVCLAEAYSAKCELDHIRPKSKGGETELSNAELTSKEYNRKKRDK